MDPLRVLFIVNPRSGVRRRRAVAEALRAFCDPHRHQVVSCDSKESLDGIIAQARDEQMDAIFAVGGDGTVHEIARRLIGGSIALGVVATGSGNGFARHFRIPLDVARAVAVAVSGHIESIDTAEANGDPFIGFMGIGFDAWVAERFASSSVRGLRTYVREVVEGYLSYKSDTYRIVIDGIESQREAILIAVANTSQYGNNARIAPRASACDGLLDVIVVRSFSLLRAPFLLARLFHGSLDQMRGVETFRAGQLTIERSEAAPVHLDGEPRMMPAKLDVRVRPGSLRVVLPPGGFGF